MRPPDNIVGAVLGNYRITAALSTGGMGEVYRAQHEILGKPAAVKVLRPELTENSELVTRFVNEAKAASAIQHPGIIEIFDFGYTDDDRAYLVMEFLEGESLAHRIGKRGKHSEVEAAQIARGIASALTAAHGKLIIHRDLKPDNIFLVSDPDLPSGERPKVLDFGIAKLADGATAETKQTRTGVLMGTPLYMAPEQAVAAGAIDQRADLYSLGCILYELLVGEPPFMGGGAGEIIAMQMFDKPVPPSARGAAVSAGLERVVMRLLEKEPDARYQTAAELVTALGSALAGASVLSTSPASGQHRTRAAETNSPLFPRTLDGAPPAKRSKLPIVLAVLALAIAGVTMFALGRRDGNETRSAVRPAAGHELTPATPSPPPPPIVDETKQPPLTVVETKPAPVVETKPPPLTVVETKPTPVVETKPPPIVEAKPPVVPQEPAPKPAKPKVTRVKPPSLPQTNQGSPIELTP